MPSVVSALPADFPAIAGLIVDDENANARGLYERVGFKHLYSGINHRLERGA